MTTFCGSEGKKPDEVATKTYRTAARHVTGHTVCPGNAIMARVYDKTQELRVHRDPEKERLEKLIWSEHGWQGEQVTRVEFQIRGEAAKELFGRQLDRATRELDAIWGYCTTRWLKLVVPGTATRLRRCDLDPRWDAATKVGWGHPDQAPAERTRERGLATAQQAFGTGLTALAQAGEMPRAITNKLEELLQAVETHDDAIAEAVLNDVLLECSDALSTLIKDGMLLRFEGQIGAAAKHALIKISAALARAERTERTLHENESEQHTVG